MSWSVVFATEEVQEELEALPRDMRASFERIVGLIRAFGLERVHQPYVRHLDDKLWEMRMTGKDGIARAIYLTATGRRLVVLRVFTKKTQKTPPREIALARQRAKDLT